MKEQQTLLVTSILLSGLALAVLLGLGKAAPIHAQSGGNYDLSWWTVDGGGGSSGGGYTLDGTIGQPDAATWSGAGYTLAGGFWGGLAVEYRVYLPLVFRNY